jgi:phage terminase large subunit-like protein
MAAVLDERVDLSVFSERPPLRRSVEVFGDQRPRILHLPPHFESDLGDRAIAFARDVAGITLDDWQEFVVRCALLEDESGNLVCFEFAIIVARQNGKDEILLVLTLAALFLLHKRLVVHTAHLYDTAQENFFRLVDIFEGSPDLMAKLPQRGGIRNANGEQGIRLKTGQRIRYRTRTKGGGRGWSGDLVIVNECMEVATASANALLPSVSARPNPQVVYAGTAVDYLEHDHCEHITRVRSRALAGFDAALGYLEWSPDATLEDADDVIDDRDAWAKANPALGRIPVEHVAKERETMTERGFLVERLSVGAWPDLDDLASAPINVRLFESREDPTSTIVGPVAFAVDVSPDGASAAIGAAGAAEDGVRHLEVVDHRKGTRWVGPRLVELLERHEHVEGVAIDLGGPAKIIAGALAKLEIEVEPVTASEHAAACGQLVAGITDGTHVHLGQKRLTDAVKGATKRSLAESWAWSRKTSKTDISPLVAVTIAAFHLDRAPAPSEPRDPLASIY